MKTKLLIGSIALMLTNIGFAQNLVVNPDFEFYSSCPVFPTGLNGNGVTNWTQPTNATSDLFHTCNTNGILDVPNNTISVGYQNSLSGDAYGGIIAWALDPATPIEFLQNQLSSPLVAGQEYTITVNLSLANNCDYYINKMGAYFSNTMVNTGNNVQLTFSPQITFGGILIDTTNWMTLSENFIATGGEQYLILGNFIPIALTNIPTGWAGSNGGLGRAYYYFDDITVEPYSALPVELIDFTVRQIQNNNVLVWNVASELNNDMFCIEHSVDAESFVQIGTVDGNGTSSEHREYTFTDRDPSKGTNYYRYKQVDFNGEFEYSPTVSIYNSYGEQEVSIHPNPSNDVFTLTLYHHSNGRVIVTDILGTEVLDIRFTSSEVVLDLKSVASKGTYFAKVLDINGKVIAIDKLHYQ